MKKITSLLIILLLVLIGCSEPEPTKKGRAKHSWEASLPENYQINQDFWDNASVYFVITDRFYNGSSSNDTSYGREKGKMNTDPAKFYGGDIAGLTQKLDYLEELGINAIWLTAPYEQIHGWCVGGSSGFPHYPYHGYYALDYTNMDANMGTVQEFRNFVDSAHAKGIRIIMDVVMNHPGYGTLEDLKNLVPGVLKKTDIENATLRNYHDSYINYDSPEWVNWWGVDWVRAGLGGGYETGSGTLLGSQASLPDFKTESEKVTGLPPFYAKKYADTVNYPTNNYSIMEPVAKNDHRVRDYLIEWLSAWVQEFGIDGFRCDTAKHIEQEAWYQLKVACTQALREWKAVNSNKKVDDSDFWMVGEVFPHGVTKDKYFTEGGFNSLINFEFRSSANSALNNIASIETTYKTYAERINNDPDFNVLSYLSSHDTGAQDSKGLFYSSYAFSSANQKKAGSLLAMCPGGIQIYYGDEAGRGDGVDTTSKGDKDQRTRSQMPWNEAGYDNLSYQFNTEIHDHWKKVLNFRKNHPAVGAGAHAQITDVTSGYAFSRIKGADKVVVVLGASEGDVTVDVSAIGTTNKVRDAYSGVSVDVNSNQATFTVDANGTLLIEAVK